MRGAIRTSQPATRTQDDRPARLDKSRAWLNLLRVAVNDAQLTLAADRHAQFRLRYTSQRGIIEGGPPRRDLQPIVRGIQVSNFLAYPKCGALQRLVASAGQHRQANTQSLNLFNVKIYRRQIIGWAQNIPHTRRSLNRRAHCLQRGDVAVDGTRRHLKGCRQPCGGHRLASRT